MAGDDFVTHCVELLGPLGPARARRMFGGHGLYAGDRFVGVIADGVLYLKVDAKSRPLFAEAGGRPFTYAAAGRSVTLGFWTVPDEAMESPAAMAPWAWRAWAAAGAKALGPTVRTPRRRAGRPPDPLPANDPTPTAPTAGDATPARPSTAGRHRRR